VSASGAPLNILTYTNLYPNNVDETHGIFVERRLQRLAADEGIRPTVVAPVPWFPSKARMFGRLAAMARISSADERGGIPVRHPRYPLIPKFGMSTSPWLMAAATRPAVREAIRDCGGVALVDAHYFYPDGVAAGMLARALGLPYVITARGSDINVIAGYAWPRRLTLNAAAGAAALVAVSQALADEMVRIGMPADRLHVLRNGVDLDFFSPADESPEGGGTGPRFLSVGALKPAKGHDVAIRFVAGIDGAELVVAGSGPDRPRLERLAEQLCVSGRVSFAGLLEPRDLRDRYRSADATILASEREGMPNVLLESLACGTPVLATRAGGIPEIVSAPEAGVLLAERSAEALTAAWRELSSRPVDRRVVRQHARRFSWAETIAALARLMRDCAHSGVREAGSLSHKSH